VQVAIHALEQGLHIAARVERLDAGERERLRGDIASLLARHGLSARDIQIIAPIREKHRRV